MDSFYHINPQNLTADPPASAYFRQAWDFCRNWRTGTAIFTRHTSGSTGAPKPIFLTRSQLQASAKITQQALDLQRGEVALVCLNVGYIAGTMMLVRGLEIGLMMYVVAPTANPLVDIPEDVAIDFAAFVPLQLQTMLENGAATRLDTFKKIIVGGAAVGDLLLQQIEELQVPVFSTYGMTETVSHVALRRLNGSDKSDCYRLLPNVETATDPRGCLRLRGPVTNDEWVQTNDLVQFIDNQNFKLLGRADNVINSGGVKIQLEKVERVLEMVLGPNLCFFAWYQPDETLGQKLVLVVQKLDNDCAIADLKTALQPQLTPYEIPKLIYYVEKFIETPTGKIDKRATFEAAKNLL